MSTLSVIEYIPNRSEATTGLFNQRLSVISANFEALNSEVTFTFPSTETLSLFSNLDASGSVHAGNRIGIGTTPSADTVEVMTLGADSSKSDYILFHDPSAAKSSYVIGSRVGGTSDGLNIWDASGATMIVSFSKQSIRFYQNVVGPVFDVGGALSSTYNAETFGPGSKETKIQAAILQASIDGFARVYLPASLLSYSASSISFIYTVQLVREGGLWTVYDAWAYGAHGNGSHDDYSALNAALSAASGAGGGTVYLPGGTYILSQTLVVPPTQSNSIHITGQGRRDAVLAPNASAITALVCGATGSDTRYVRFADFSISPNHSLKTGCGIHMIRPQFCEVRDVNIEEFDGTDAVGLYLEGNTAAPTPHAWRSKFYNVFVATTRRPLVMVNADENEFYSSNFGCQTGLLSLCTAVELRQGRNNRFYGLLLSGEVSSLTTGRPNYCGFQFASPTTGDNSGNQIYGIVAEGFESGVSIGSAVTNAVVMFYQPSISSADILDAGTGTLYWAPQTSLLHPTYQWPSGTSRSPAFAFRSEGSLGWMRSDTSTMGLSPTGRLVVGSGDAFSRATQPEYGFGGEPTMGLRRSNASTVEVWAANTLITRFSLTGGIGAIHVPNGSSITPSLGFASETSLGFYRSGASSMELAFGRLIVPGTPFSANTPTITFASNKSTGLIDNTIPGLDVVVAGTVAGRAVANQWLTAGGTVILPTKAFTSETSLGFFRSGVSRLGLSYGQFSVPDGSNTTPSIGLSSATSVGFYSSGVQTIAISVGTFNLATNSVRLSMRTQASLSSTNMAVNEVAFSIDVTSSASLAIRSGSTIYYFASSNSTKA